MAESNLPLRAAGQRNRLRWASGLCAVVALAPHAALACPACAETAFEFSMPQTYPLGIVLVGWLIAAFFVRNRLRSAVREDFAEGGVPSWNAVVYFAWALGAVMLVCVFTMTPVVWLFLLTSVWLVFLLVKVGRAVARTDRPPATRLFLRLNAAALALSLLLIPAAFAWARRPEQVVRYLGNPHYGHGVIQSLIAGGEASVPHLSGLLDHSFSHPDSVSNYRVAQACYCLSRIGGDEGRGVLRRLVTERVPNMRSVGSRWQVVACCTYAERAGPAAVADLIELHRRATGEAKTLVRLSALCGLARTGSREGIGFVLDHLSEILSPPSDEGLDGSAWEVALSVAELLIVECDAALLCEAPIYTADHRGWQFGINEATYRAICPPGTRPQDSRSRALRGPVKDPSKLAEVWNRHRAAIRDAWARQ